MSNKRAISINQLFRTRMRTLEFSGEWRSAMGCPEPNGTWIIWGNPGNGKTRFALQLAKYLTTFGCRLAYDSLEEGVSQSLRRAIVETNIQEVSRRFILLDKEPIPELIQRLERKKSPEIIVIDSLQYSGINYSEYKALKDQFRHKLFILVSHAEGSKPAGRVARSIHYDANIKIWVQGYQAFAAGRYGGGEPYTIWEEGAFNCMHPKIKSDGKGND